jgi:ABC-type dipeptide/oligopeptide/nickel transport system permease subunit
VNLRANWPFTAGLGLLLLVVFLAGAGPALAPQDPVETHTVAQVDGEFVPIPYPPLTVPGFPLGTDNYGRDLLSRLLWAVRPTLVIVVLVSLIRLLIGVALGTAAGWAQGRQGRVLEGVIAAALAVPTLIAAVMVITAMGIQPGRAAFVIGLVATGWADTARLVSEQTRLLKGQPYVEAARALGSSGTETVVRHIVRQITPLLGMLFAFEAGSTLMVLAALGFLGYYVGGAYWIVVGDFTAAAASGLPELGQMLADSWDIFKPWATVAAGTMIFLTVLGFNLLGEGLRRRLSRPELGRGGAVSAALGRVSAALDELLLTPGQAAARGRVLTALTAAAVLTLAALIWKPWQARSMGRELAAPRPALAAPGGHLWASERHDAYGTLASPQTDETPAALRWVLTDASGFPGGPVVDAEGAVYAAAGDGTVYAVTRDGEMRWQASLPAEGSGLLALGPAAADDGESAGVLYVTDRAGGLSAFTTEGELLWRRRSETGRRASSGPVVSRDGTIYYTVVNRVEAVSPAGEPVWTSDLLPGQGETMPRLDPDEKWVFVQDAVLDRATGRLADFSAIVEPGRAGVNAAYLVGGDGRTYLREEHALVPVDLTGPVPQRGERIHWNYRGSTIFLPYDGGVTPGGAAWLLYGSNWDDLRYVVLSPDNRLLTNFNYPQRSPRAVAVDAAGRAYLCGEKRVEGVECISLTPDQKEPAWQVDLPNSSGHVTGGALAPGRLYVTTQDGYLYAIGDK